MVTVLITKTKKGYQKIHLKGHALYDDYGKDIVCAGISSILITTVNAILKYDKQAINVSQNKDVLITIKKQDNIVTLLLENMIDLLKELANTYPKNISIREDEKDE